MRRMTVSSRNFHKVVTIGTIGSSPALLCSRLVSDMVHNGIDDDDRQRRTDKTRLLAHVCTSDERTSAAQKNVHIYIK
jgi:hypothetical protein